MNANVRGGWRRLEQPNALSTGATVGLAFGAVPSESHRGQPPAHAALAIDHLPPKARLHTGSEAQLPLPLDVAYMTRIVHRGVVPIYLRSMPPLWNSRPTCDGDSVASPAVPSQPLKRISSHGLWAVLNQVQDRVSPGWRLNLWDG